MLLPVLALLLCHVISHVPSATANKNVVLIIADDMRPDTNFYSNMGVKTSDVTTPFHTPNLDLLAGESLVMTRAYAQVALCGPSRASFLTSRYPDTIKVIGNQHNFRDTRASLVTLPQYFKDVGYDVRGMGKIFHGDAAELAGWTEYVTVTDNWKTAVKDSWRAITPEERAAAPLIDDLIRDAAVNTLDQVSAAALSDTKNFFMAVGFRKPHLDWVFPQEFMDHYPDPTVTLPPNSQVPTNFPEVAWSKCNTLCTKQDIIATGINCNNYDTSQMPDAKTLELRRAYYSCVSYIDSLVGDVLQKLDDLGLSDNTVVAFMGDHGWHLREQNAWCKTTNFEAALRIPLVVRVPGATDGGVRTDKLTEALDVMPTLIEAAGLAPLPACPANDPLSMDACTEGHSLVPLMADANLPTWKDKVYSQVQRSGKGIQNAPADMMGYSVRDDSYRYNHYVEFNTSTWQPLWKRLQRYEGKAMNELYDLVNDEWQTTNLINLSGGDSNETVRLKRLYYNMLSGRFPTTPATRELIRLLKDILAGEIDTVNI